MRGVQWQRRKSGAQKRRAAEGGSVVGTRARARARRACARTEPIQRMAVHIRARQMNSHSQMSHRGDHPEAGQMTSAEAPGITKCTNTNGSVLHWPRLDIILRSSGSMGYRMVRSISEFLRNDTLLDILNGSVTGQNTMNNEGGMWECNGRISVRNREWSTYGSK